MKLAKSHKIILIVTALALSLLMAVCAFNLFSVNAETVASPTASNYFTADSVEMLDGGAKFTVEDGKTVSIKNELAIDDMAIELGASENISKLEMILTYDSFYVNGNKNAEGKFDKEIENTFDITSKTSLTVVVQDNVVKVDGVETAGDYYKIRKVDKAVAKIEFKATLVSGQTSGSFIIKSIDQKASGTGYKQIFKSENMEIAKPIISLDADMFIREKDGSYSLVAYAGQEYTLSYDVYSVVGNQSASDFSPSIESDAKITLFEDDKNEIKDSVYFKTSAVGALDAQRTFSIKDEDGVVVETYVPTVVKKNDGANKAPEYLVADIAPYDVTDKLALEAFVYELKNQYKQEDGKDVPLGTEIEIPSMEDFVYDDRTPYDKLTKKLYLVSKSESTSSSLEITLNSVGEYYFYVIFTDTENEAMDVEDVIKVENDEVTCGKYGSKKSEIATNQKYIFYFTIEEDNEIVITVPKQGDGYKGSKYTASKFDITSSNCEITYALYYNADKEATEDSEGWVEIKKFSDIDEDYDDGNYDYETLEAINYDGQYVFTPDKIGAYKITVNVASKMSFMSNSASSIIKVGETAKVITPSAFDWVKDNVWSVVFLSVGTACLIAIIVLLCVKPKDKKVDEE